jgi:hypothetical protein
MARDYYSTTDARGNAIMDARRLGNEGSRKQATEHF